MKKYIFTIAVCLMSVELIGQSTITMETGMLEARLLKANTPAEGASGSPYLSGEFILASVDNFEQNYLVRFNAAEGVMEFKNENSVTLVMSNQEDHVVRLLDGSGYIYKTADFFGDRALLRESWADGEGNAFFVKEEVKFYPKKEANNSYDTEMPPRYERVEDIFYFKNSEGEMTELPQKKKKLIDLFESRGAKQFLKKNKVNLKSEEGMLTFIKGCLLS